MTLKLVLGMYMFHSPVFFIFIYSLLFFLSGDEGKKIISLHDTVWYLVCTKWNINRIKCPNESKTIFFPLFFYLVPSICLWIAVEAKVAEKRTFKFQNKMFIWIYASSISVFYPSTFSAGFWIAKDLQQLWNSHLLNLNINRLLTHVNSFCTCLSVVAEIKIN